MNVSVNLVPGACRAASLRRRRRQTWTAVVAALALFVTSGAGVRLFTRRALGSMETRRAALRQQQAEIERQTGLAEQQRAALLEQAGTLSVLRREEMTAQRLGALGLRAPEEVVLTELRATSEGPTEVAAPSPRLRIVLNGYALDSQAVLDLVDTIKEVEGWSDVMLLHTNKQLQEQAELLAFGLEYRQRGARP